MESFASGWYVLWAALPIAVVLYLMIGRNWTGSWAGGAGWLTAVVLALLVFGGNLPLLLVAWGKSLLLAGFVLYIIWMALLLYHTINEAGVIGVIGQELPGLAHNKPIQALLIAWVFASFLQGATGFGVPAAVVAPLLVGMGFEADVAVVMALLGHGWAVTFGSLGSSFLSLMAATNMPGEQLAGPTAVLLGVGCFLCGLGVLWLAGRGTAVRQGAGFLLVFGFIMASAQWAIAVSGLWTLASFGAGLVGLLLAVAYLAANQYRTGSLNLDHRRLLAALAPYGLLILVIVLGEFVFKHWLGLVEINAHFPQVSTRFGWVTEAGDGRSISLFGHAGALLLYVSLLSYGLFAWRGTLTPQRPYQWRTILQKTVRGSIQPTIGILGLIAMALTMQHVGMTERLAEALSQTGSFFPLLSPFIGALGSFMTGSNTNSNVVFGPLQAATAQQLHYGVALILAAQTSGGALGSLFAPAKVIVGASTVPGAHDGRVLKLATIYGLVTVLVIGLLVWWIA